MTHRPAKYLLAVRGISQRAVALSYGCGHTYLNDVLAGRRGPSRALRSHIAQMLELAETTVWPEYAPERKAAPADDDGGHKTEAATTSGVST